MTKWVELRRHTASEGDALTSDGMRAAVDIGGGLHERYQLLVSSGAQRGTQTLACILAGMERVHECGVTVDTGFRSAQEDRWFAVARGVHGGGIEAFRAADPELVEQESRAFAAALRRVFAQLPENGRAMVVGHPPMHEVAIYGLCGELVPPISKGAALVVTGEGDGYRLTGAAQ
jgi:broad specificity phosphatase PhoE